MDELIKILNPESNYVFYDDSHGFCINTQDVLDHLCAMPSAQLAQDLTNGCTDTISREAAIEAMRKAKDKSELHRMLVQLPSAQPECEDAVSRSHFDERVRLAGGMSEEELTDDFKDGVLTVLEMLKTEPPVTPKQPEPMMIRVDSDLSKEEYEKLIKDIGKQSVVLLPKEEAQPRWIPCKTRKPEKSGLYLVTKQQKTGEIQLATAHYNTAFDEWSGNGNFKKVLAWQPLPSPWRGEKDA